MSQPALELRIYTGLHAGAKAAFSAPDQTMHLGSDPNNDVILRDATFASAQITLLPEGWRWVLTEVDQTIPWAACVRIKDLVLAVDYQNASWPSPDNLTIALHQGLDTEATTPTDEANTPQTEPEQATTDAEIREIRINPDEAPVFVKNKTKPTIAASVLVACVLVLALGVFGWQRTKESALSSAAFIPQVKKQATDLQPSQTAQLQALQNAVAAAGYAKLVRVQPQAESKYQLIGVVGNEAQLDELLRAASTVTRRILPSVLTQSEFAARLKSIAPQLPQGVLSQAMAVGVVGLKASDTLATSLQQAQDIIKRELPEMVGFDIVTAAAESAEPQVLGATTNKNLKNTLLPKVAAIQSGPNSYVLLTNGRKVMPGGGLENHKLLSIEDNALVLEDKSGQTVRVTR